MLPRRAVLPVILLLTATGLGCQGREAPPPPSDAESGLPGVVLRNRLRGVLLGEPQAKPDLTLTATDGGPFSLRRDTEGLLTLVFFGYTHCPDICPLHMANLGRAMKELPPEVSSRIRVVFITTDPERDTPDQLRGWLNNFHPEFIGLTGTPDQIRNAQTAAGLMPAFREIPDSSQPANYYVAHAGQITAYTPDGLAHIIYPSGIRQGDFANDLPILVNGWPE